MSQDALIQAVSKIAAQIKANPASISQHVETLKKTFPDVTEAKVKAALAQVSAGDLDLKGALGAAKGLFGKK